MKYSYILALLLLPLCFQTQAQTYSSTPKPTSTAKENDEDNIQKKNQRLQKQASELTAKYIPLTKLETEGLEAAKLEEYKNEEDLMFPADELYNSNWDTLNVNPFQNNKIEFPSTYTINCYSFTMPVDNNNDYYKVTSKYGPRRRRMHRGIDLKVQVGDTIKAAFDGKVRIKSYERRGYGYYLVVRHPNGLETVYGHLSKFLVQENDIVRAGQPIALGGSTGRSTGSHLHFETRFLGRDIDPADIIDFENGVPYKDEYVFNNNVKINGRNSNIYTYSDEMAIHRVKKGETLSQIAQKYGTTVTALCQLNNLTRNSKLAIGQRIRFRAKQIKVQTTEDAVKQTSSATDKTASTRNISKSNKVIVSQIEAPNESEGPVYYQIRTGDTLFSLAKRYGISVEKLCELNNFKRNTIIKVGQKIRCS